MKLKSDDHLVLAITLTFVVAIAIIWRGCDPGGTNTSQQPVVLERKIVVPAETLFVDRVQSRVVYRPMVRIDTVKDTVSYIDTVLSTRPFTASMDTTIGCNQISITYSFPEHVFSDIKFVTCADTIITSDTVYQPSDATLTDKIKYVGYGAIGGFILGIIAK